MCVSESALDTHPDGRVVSPLDGARRRRLGTADRIPLRAKDILLLLLLSIVIIIIVAALSDYLSLSLSLSISLACSQTEALCVPSCSS